MGGLYGYTTSTSGVHRVVLGHIVSMNKASPRIKPISIKVWYGVGGVIRDDMDSVMTTDRSVQAAVLFPVTLGASPQMFVPDFVA